MADVLAFQPKARPARPVAPPLDMRARRRAIEEAAQAAIDTAERLVTLLDAMDGNPANEDAEPRLDALESDASHVAWLRGPTVITATRPSKSQR